MSRISAKAGEAEMIVDLHVHLAANVWPDGIMSDSLLNSAAFRFVRWKVGVKGRDAATDRQFAQALRAAIADTPQLDAAVILAFDGVVDESTGEIDRNRTQFYVSNDHALRFVRDEPRALFGASVNPLRRDALAELDRCVAGGAVLLKWLPIVQGFDPSDRRCIPFYEALAHYKLPLLCHTGGEKSLRRINDDYADPNLLIPALERGVTVIMAHCGTKSAPFERDRVEAFRALAHRYEKCFGDTAALNLPMRWHAYRMLWNDRVAMSKLVHGSDWPIVPLPPLLRMRADDSLRAMMETNWLKRDAQIKELLGFDEAYWHRGATLLRRQA